MTAQPQQPSGGFVRRMATAFALMAVGLALALASAGPATADEHRLTICHATGADENNPYVVITPAKAGVLQGHYGTGRGDHQDGDDIIPEFEYRGTTYPAQGDQRILANGCRPLTTTTTSSTTTSSGTSVSTTTQTTTTQSTTATTTTTATLAGGTTPVVPKTEAKTTPPQRTAAGATAAGGTAAGRTAGPIPGAVDAGMNEASSWQLPVGGALILLGAAGMTTTVLRRKSAKR